MSHPVQTPHCVVVGASGGIGRPLVQRLLARGWTVEGVGRKTLPIVHPRFTAHRCDLQHRGQVEALAARLDTSDRVVFAHGVFCSEATFIGEVELQHLVNVHAVRWFCDAIEAPKRTVFLGSHAWKRARLEDIDASTGLRAYRASKRALLLYGLGLARRGWNVHTIHPGVVRTEIASQASASVRLVHRILQGTVGIEADVAAGHVERLLTEPVLSVPSATYWNQSEPFPSVTRSLVAESYVLQARWSPS